MLLILPVHGQVILCFGARILMILKIGIGVIGHRGLKLDGAIGQGEICNSLKSEKF